MYCTANYAHILFQTSNFENKEAKTFIDKLDGSELKQNDHGQYFILKDIDQSTLQEHIPQ